MDIYLFRGARIGITGNAIWCAAPIAAVSGAFGGGGFYGEEGLLAAFGGGALLRNQVEENILLGVWGARKCSRFRRLLREAGYAGIIKPLPPELRVAICWRSPSVAVVMKPIE